MRKFWVATVTIHIFLFYFSILSYGQKIPLAELLLHQRESFNQMENYLTKNGWQITETINSSKRSGVVWGKYDETNIQSIVGYVTLKDNSFGSMKPGDSAWIIYRSFSSSYNANFINDLNNMNYTQEKSVILDGGIQKHYINLDLNSHIVIEETKSEDGLYRYSYDLLTTGAFLAWYLDKISETK